MLGPLPDGFVECAVPEWSLDRPPRTPEQFSALKRATIGTIKEIGRLQQGKAVDYQWAFWAAHMLAQKLGEPTGMAIDETMNEGLVIRVHNEAVRQLRKWREKMGLSAPRD